MENEEKVILTQEGLDKVNKELEERKNKNRKEIADEIELARQQGDLSENAAYHAAIKDKEFNENRIDELERIIKNAVVKKSNPKNKKIDIGETFILKNLKTNKEIKYTLVGANEAEPSAGKISINSPIGSKTMGASYDEIIEVDLPIGKVEFKILKAS